ALRKLGNEVYILSPPGVDIENPETDSSKSKNRWITKIYEVLPQSILEILRCFYNFFAYFRFKEAVRKYKIDFIYERYAFLTWVGPYFARKYRIPIILEVNEASGLDQVTGQVMVKLATSLEKRIFKIANAIIVVSNFLKRHIQKMGINEDKVFVIPNAVNPEVFDPDTVEDNLRRKLDIEDKLIIGFVGIFLPWNNLELLIDVFKEVARENPKTHLLLVGDGPLKNTIERKVHQEGLRDKVTLAGKVNYRDVPKFIHSMDICVIPQSNQYRSPVKLFEYMAMAKPVVAPCVEPIKSVIMEYEDVVLFEPGDRDLLKKAIRGLIEIKNSRKKIGNKARKTIIKKYTWQNNAKKIVEIYKSSVHGQNVN
ncbi:hypothetical protein DRN85_08895, partial [Methanosarcinales archaeon]